LFGWSTGDTGSYGLLALLFAFFFVARDRQGPWPHLFPGIMVIRAGEEEEEEEEIGR
jgi:hypothetical protein